jgi:hypothetical protein
MKETAMVDGSGDTYRRREVSPGVYQCGCYWTRCSEFGDVLVECDIHYQATVASVSKFEREARTNSGGSESA